MVELVTQNARTVDSAIAFAQVIEKLLVFLRTVRMVSEEYPAEALERLSFLAAHLAPFLFTDFVHRIVESLDDMKPVQDKMDVRAVFLDGADEGFAHVAAGPFDLLLLIIAELFVEKPIDGFAPLTFTYPKHAGALKVVYDGNVFVPFPVRNLVDPDAPERSDPVSISNSFDDSVKDIRERRFRDMKQLRQQARGILQHGQAAANVDAFRRAFDSLKGDRRKLAGCATFDQLVATEHGMTLIGLPHLSLDQPFDNDDDDDPLVEHLPAVTEGSLAEAVASRRDAQDWVEALIAARPDWFSPVMRWLFRALLRDGRPLFDGCGEQGVLGDSAFKHLIEQDEALATLADQALAIRLMADANALIDRGRRLCKDGLIEHRGGGRAHAERSF